MAKTKTGKKAANTNKVVPLKPKAKKPKVKAASKPKPKAKTAPKPKAQKPKAKTATAPKARKAPKRAAPKKPAATKQTQAPSQPKTRTSLTMAPLTLETMMKPNTQQFDQFTKDAADISRESMDAFVKSGQIFAKGFEAIVKESMALAQTAAEKQMQFAKDAMTSKSINEFSDIQNKIAQSNFDDFMAGATKISELGVKVLTEAVEPINEQVTKSVQKVGIAA